MPQLLIHICCAHCAAYTVDYWKKQGYAVTGFWYNPNIHPYTEHEARLAAVRQFAQETALPLFEAPGYDMPEYFRRVAGHEDQRCRHCFILRLAVTAREAKKRGFDAFTSTLLISPHQKHDLLREIGEQSASAFEIEFLYADLRKHYSDSRHMTKPMELFRQQYCGCIYSEVERYLEKPFTRS